MSAPVLGAMSLNACTKITVQRDLENNCVDICLFGAEKYFRTRISVWGVYGEGDPAMPLIEMLPDVQKETADAE